MKWLRPISFLIFCATTLCSALLIVPAKGQTIFCPPNINFEQGNFSNWQFFTGNCCPINATTSGVVNNRHTITSGSNIDQYGGFPIVAPSGGSYSLRLGNNINGSQSEKARYYVKVPSGPGKHILLYRYAIVLEDPAHAPNSQPRFEVNAYDSATNTPLNCAQISYVSSSALPGFVKANSTNTVYYKPWTTATIDMTAHAGNTVAIEFSVGDCSLGGHFGYAYIDMNCGLYQIEGTICNGDSSKITLNGPQGYQAYEWRNSTLTTILGTTQTLVIPMPSGPTTFAVIMTPYPGFGCKDTLYTTFTTPVSSYISVTASSDTTICIGGKATLNSAASGPDGPYTFLWAPATGLSCTLCANPVITANAAGTYSVIGKNLLGCADTNYVHITVDSVIKAGIAVPADSVCSNDTVMLINAKGPNPPNRTQNWVTPGGVQVSGGGMSDTVKVYYSSPGQRTAYLNIAFGNSCFARDTADLYVGSPITITTSNDAMVCPKQTILLAVSSNSQFPVNYIWTPATSLSCSNCTNPIASPTGTTTYIVYGINSTGCKDTGMIVITVDTPTNADILFAVDTICVNERLHVKNTGENLGLTDYLWQVDTGNIVYGAGTDSIVVHWKTPGVKKIRHRAFRGFCESVDSQFVTVLAIPIAGFELPKYTCLGQAVSLFPLPGAPHYKWSVQDHNITDTIYEYKYNLLWNSIGGKTIKLVVNDKHCADSMERTIDIYPYPIAEILHSDARLCKGKEFTLEATEGYRYSYAWSPPQFFTTNTDNEVKGIAEQTGYIILEVTNEWNCSARDSFFAEVQSCCELLLPNAFTPDRNGRNDIFRPVNREDKKIVDFMIANRRGQIVYKTSDSKGWDGFHNGQPAAQDTYNYYIRYICNGEEAIQKGTLILMR